MLSTVQICSRGKGPLSQRTEMQLREWTEDLGTCDAGGQRIIHVLGERPGSGERPEPRSVSKQIHGHHMRIPLCVLSDHMNRSAGSSRGRCCRTFRFLFPALLFPGSSCGFLSRWKKERPAAGKEMFSRVPGRASLCMAATTAAAAAHRAASFTPCASTSSANAACAGRPGRR